MTAAPWQNPPARSRRPKFGSKFGAPSVLELFGNPSVSPIGDPEAPAWPSQEAKAGASLAPWSGRRPLADPFAPLTVADLLAGFPEAGPLDSGAGVAGGRPSLETPATSCTTLQQPGRADPSESYAFRDAVARELGRAWPARAKALELCGRAGVRLACRPCGGETLVPYRCRTRTCPHAQRAGAAAMAARLNRRVRVHDQQQGAVTWDGDGRKARRGWKLLTLTVPVSENVDLNFSRQRLRAGVLEVRRAVSRFWRLTAWGNQVRRLSPVTGKMGKRARRDTSAVCFLEIGPASGMPHAHLMVYGEFIAQPVIAAAWSRALGRPAFVSVSAVEDAEDALREVVKYVAKGSKDLATIAPRSAAVELAFRHVHRGSVLGALRKVKADAADVPDSVDLTREDVHATKEAACEGCGCIGEWEWRGVTSAAVVTANAGYGYIRDPGVLLAGDVLPAGFRVPLAGGLAPPLAASG